MKRAFLLVILAALPCNAIAASALDDYIRLQTGSFDTSHQAKLDARYDTAILHVAEIWRETGESKTGARWLYSESWLKDAAAPYMQRISRLAATDDGSISAERYEIPDAKRFVGAWKRPTMFASLKPAALTALAGCDAIITRTGTERFEGGTIGSRCRNAYKGSTYAISSSAVSGDGFTNWDRGFGSDGRQTWGPAYGGYRFERIGIDSASRCVDPVRMLVYGEITDRAKFAAYGRALSESGLYPRNGGYYEAATPALAVFEGEPPPTRGVIIARFPCLDAAKRFWNSPEYAEIRKLRAGLARFEVLVMPAAQLPKTLAE